MNALLKRKLKGVLIIFIVGIVTITILKGADIFQDQQRFTPLLFILLLICAFTFFTIRK